MKALVLAAGLGTRLSPITDSCPKCMAPVNGKPIIEKQIENLLENNIIDITVIGGYLYDTLEQFIHSKFPDVKVINSVDYATTNNMYSAYMGKDYVGQDDFLMMNADVYFDSSVIKTLINFDKSNAIVTDIGAYLEESMKVIEKDGHLIEIAKTITKEDALGNSIDVYKFSKEGGNAFFEKCREYIEDKKELKKWSEVALNDILKDVNFYACPLVGRWYEIDNHDDLKIAEELFRK